MPNNPTKTKTLPTERIARLKLSMVPGIGSILFHRILAQLGSAQAALSLSPHEWAAVSGIGLPSAVRWQKQLSCVDPNSMIDECARHNVQLVIWGDADYPELLQQIADPPPVLFAQGNLSIQATPCIAIVGTRHMTRYGERLTRRFSQELTEHGLAVVSGLARGVDRVAHETALQCQGLTIAVIGSGHTRVYPSEHRALAESLRNDGLILSEYRPTTPVKSNHFPQRNRIIAGLCLGVVVVEAALRSGALITARHAVEQNRDVFAIPGPIDQRMSSGCHRLIKEGAKLVESVDDILEELQAVNSRDGSAAPELDLPTLEGLSEDSRKILDAIEAESTLIDEVVSRTGLTVARVLTELFTLEGQGLVARASGGRLTRPR